jgi:hypothetical protein
MMCRDSKHREVEIELGGASDDIQVTSAVYTDEQGGDVPDDEVEWIYENYAESIYVAWYEQKQGEAEYYYEGDR